MGKALVIRDVDFSANKLSTVELDNSIPCTGLTLSQSALALTTVGATATLTATVAPYNTTDTVIWTSSAPAVATVAGGVVTQNGVGTATITATCGTITATCAVTCTVVYTEDDLAVEVGYGLIQNGSKDNMKAQAADIYAGYALLTNATGGYQAVTNGESVLGHAVYPIPIPSGAESLTITFPDDTMTAITGLYFYYLDSKTNQTTVSGVDAASYVADLSITTNTTPSISEITSYTVDLEDVPAGADSCILDFRSTTPKKPPTWNSEVVLVFA